MADISGFDSVSDRCVGVCFSTPPSLENGSAPTLILQRSSVAARTSNDLHALAAPPAALLGSPATASCVKLIFATAAFKTAGEMGKE
jgi:hypothetical protein